MFLDIPKDVGLNNKCQKFWTSLSEEGDNVSIDSDGLDNLDKEDNSEEENVDGEIKKGLRRRKKITSFNASRG